MTEIVIQGIGGRMGHVLCDMIAQREDCRVVAGIDMKDGEQNGIPVYDSLEKLNGKGDVIIDFSSPAAVEKALPYCQTHKLPIVVCTTGLSEELQLKVVQLSRSVPVFKSANMSMGINLLLKLRFVSYKNCICKGGNSFINFCLGCIFICKNFFCLVESDFVSSYGF